MTKKEWLIEWASSDATCPADDAIKVFSELPTRDLAEAITILTQRSRVVSENVGKILEARGERRTISLAFQMLDRLADIDDTSAEFVKVAKELCSVNRQLRQENESEQVVYKSKKLINEKTKTLDTHYQKSKLAEVESLKSAIAEEEKKTAENALREAQYARLLSQGRKKQTLQQAHANGDFIPVDDTNQVYIPSSTGKRLGDRG
jgi:hypothetical protein